MTRGLQVTSQSPAVVAAAVASRATAGGGPAELVLPASPQAWQPCLEHPRTLHLAALLLPRPEPYTHTSVPFQTLRTCSEVPEPPRVCSTHDRVSISTADPGPLVSSRPSGGLWAAGRREQPQESPSQQHGDSGARRGWKAAPTSGIRTEPTLSEHVLPLALARRESSRST